MGEDLTLFRAKFNGAIRIEAGPERLTSEAGAVRLREMLERLGLTAWLTARLDDPRDPDLVTHPLAELLHTARLLVGQGWRDHDDADTLRADAALRLAVSRRRGVTPLRAPADVRRPDGWASQPTRSRWVRTLSAEGNRTVLRAGLLELAARRACASRGGCRPRYLTVDVDSLPIEVHGHRCERLGKSRPPR